MIGWKFASLVFPISDNHDISEYTLFVQRTFFRMVVELFSEGLSYCLHKSESNQICANNMTIIHAVDLRSFSIPYRVFLPTAETRHHPTWHGQWYQMWICTFTLICQHLLCEFDLQTNTKIHPECVNNLNTKLAALPCSSLNSIGVWPLTSSYSLCGVG